MPYCPACPTMTVHSWEKSHMSTSITRITWKHKLCRSKKKNREWMKKKKCKICHIQQKYHPFRKKNFNSNPARVTRWRLGRTGPPNSELLPGLKVTCLMCVCVVPRCGLQLPDKAQCHFVVSYHNITPGPSQLHAQALVNCDKAVCQYDGIHKKTQSLNLGFAYQGCS